LRWYWLSLPDVCGVVITTAQTLLKRPLFSAASLWSGQTGRDDVRCGLLILCAPDGPQSYSTRAFAARSTLQRRQLCAGQTGAHRQRNVQEPYVSSRCIFFWRYRLYRVC
jgi:hypothetical protein